MKFTFLVLAFLFFTATNSFAAPGWEARLDSDVRFYQTTDFGVLVVGTERSLYAVDGVTGETVWRRNLGSLDENAITPVPETDLILISLEDDNRSRVEAVDLLTGNTIWRSDRVKGKVLQLAVEPEQNLLAAVLVKNPRGQAGEEIKRSPVVHVFQLDTGDELWKRELDSDVALMPARFEENSEAAFTLDNYRAPLILDGRLFLFYEGATSFNARTGEERERDKFGINEGGLALTEADPVFDDQNVYTTGRGKVRAVSRQTGATVWEAKDLGVTPELALVNDVLLVRTGGQFTRIKNGETETKGAFGVSAINTKTGKTIWRYKGADKGLTNFVLPDANTILIADRDDLISINAQTGERTTKVEHGVKDAAFVLINESRQAVVGGREELAAFQISNLKSQTSNSQFQTENQQIKVTSFDKGQRTKDKEQPAVWRAKHKAPGRGLLKTIASIALRATALYFRYGGLATTGFNLIRGANALRSLGALRVSGLRNGVANLDLTSLATNAARNYVSGQINTFGIAARARINSLGNIGGIGNIGNINSPRLPNLPSISRPNLPRPSISTPSRAEVQEGLLDRLDPARQLDKLADYLGRRKRLAALRGNFMYFYTELPTDGKGLVGVNVQNGRVNRVIRLSDPDPRFITDEASGLLYTADGRRLSALELTGR